MRSLLIIPITLFHKNSSGCLGFQLLYPVVPCKILITLFHKNNTGCLQHQPSCCDKNQWYAFETFNCRLWSQFHKTEMLCEIVPQPHTIQLHFWRRKISTACTEVCTTHDLLFSVCISHVSLNKPIWKASQHQNAVTSLCIVHNPFPLSPCSIVWIVVLVYQ